MLAMHGMANGSAGLQARLVLDRLLFPLAIALALALTGLMAGNFSAQAIPALWHTGGL